MTINELDQVVRKTIKRYENMLKEFVPCKPGSGEFLEQNLITNFAIAYIDDNANANIFTEVPFMCENNYWKCRADMYIQNGENGYIIEAKGSQKGENFFDLIEEDVKRLSSDGLRESFKVMAQGGEENLPKNMYGVIIADFWGTKNKAPDHNTFIKQWNENNFSERPYLKKLIKIDAYKINIDSDYPYWFLVGIIDLEWAKRNQ